MRNVQWPVVLARLIDILIPSRVHVRLMQAEKAAHWVRVELEKGLAFRGQNRGIQLDWFEHELAKIIHTRLLMFDCCTITNPRMHSPVDIYRTALERAGVDVDQHISIALPEHQLRIADGCVKAYGGSPTAGPARIYISYA